MTMDEVPGGGRLLGNPDGDVILIHGAGASADLYQDVLPLLPRAMAIDLPGHGTSALPGLASIRSYVDWLSDFARQRGVAHPIFGGHSMGGAIALTLGLTNALAPRALILISTGARLRVHPDLLAGLAGGAFPAEFLQALTSKAAPPSLVDRMGSCPVQVTLDDFRACDAFDVLDRLSGIRCPTLTLVGEEDVYTPVRYGERMARETGGAFAVIPGSGHLLPLEQAAEVARRIQTFLDTAVDHPALSG